MIRGRYFLRQDDRFCVLGVLCNLHAQAHPDIAATQTDPDQYLDQREELPTDVMKWAGMGSTCGDFNERDTLAELNDRRLCFSELANVIEENWVEL